MPEASNHWASNIKFLRNRLGLSQDALSEQLGIKRSKLNAHENGQTVNPTAEDLIHFSSFFKLSIDTLMKVDLANLSEAKFKELEAGNDSYITGRKMRVLATAVDQENNDQIEYVPHKARAGYLLGYSDPEFISKLPSFHMPHLPRDRKFRMFQTVGDSMYPIPENCLVIGNYVEDWSSLKNDVPCIVVSKEDGIVFKLVSEQIGKNRTLLLRSLNSAYPPYEVPAADILEVWRFVNYISDSVPEPEQTLQEMSKSLHEIREELRKLREKSLPVSK